MPMNDKTPPRPKAPHPPKPSVAVPIEAIEEAIAGIRFGVVQLIIQDGRVVQIDKTEKIRFA
jgi:hypothetical protein